MKRDPVWLSDVINSPEHLYNPNAWDKLQKDIASNYTMDEERIMFEHIMKGANQDDSGDDIELF